MFNILRTIGSGLLGGVLRTIGAKNTSQALKTVGGPALSWLANKAGSFIDGFLGAPQENQSAMQEQKEPQVSREQPDPQQQQEAPIMQRTPRAKRRLWKKRKNERS